MCLLGSILAPTGPPRTLQSRPRAPKSRPRQAKSCPRADQDAQEQPRTRRGLAQEAQDSPRACQEPTKMPRSSPGPAQDLLRIRPGPPRTARDPTHYLRLEKKSQLHNAILQNFFPSHKAAEIKNERRRHSPQGGLQSAAQRGRRARWGTRGLRILPSISFGILLSEVLVFPLLNPPPVASGRLPPLRRSAALARLGASWAEKIAFQEAFKN